jgi:hypothetical protein
VSGFDDIRRAVDERIALLAEVEKNQRALRALADGGVLSSLKLSGIWPRPAITFGEEMTDAPIAR